jgi:hypothetical protein
MSVESKARMLCEYIGSLKDFSYVEPEPLHRHMGAIIADAILQSGLNFETVVKPRVQKILNNHPEAATTTGFLKTIEKSGLNALLEWRDPEKPRRVLEVTKLFAGEGVETPEQLKVWLENGENVAKLDAVKGVGSKTLDYFRFLSGIPTAAVDRHLLNFLKKAGVSVIGYDEAKHVINRAADIMGKDRCCLDQSIWTYMSKKRALHKR